MLESSVRDAYFETQINTATPQRLRLMLIEGALRDVRRAQAAWQAADMDAGRAAIDHCREIVAELIAGIRPEQTQTAKKVLGLYLFIFSALVEAQASGDVVRLAEVVRILDEERQTWQEVCQQMPERPVAEMLASTEELAPQRVTGSWSPSYGGQAVSGQPSSGQLAAFAIDA
jgi:flagellar protein FliS